MGTREYHEGLWQALPEGLEPPDLALRRRFLLDHVSAGERVLDVGCGEGSFAAALLARAAPRSSASTSPRSRCAARGRATPSSTLRLIDGEGSWALEDASFDVVWAGEVIEHVADTAAWLSEVRRVLRSGGRLLLSTPDHGARTRAAPGALQRARSPPLRPARRPSALLHPRHAPRAARDFGFDAVDVRCRRRARAARARCAARF